MPLRRILQNGISNRLVVVVSDIGKRLTGQFSKVFRRAKQPKEPAQGYVPKAGMRGKNVQWVPCSPVVLDKMLSIANVTPDDIVFDPGSGDGRIVIRVAKLGARAFGVETNPELLTLSEQNAVKEGVGDRAAFSMADFFETDFSKATVVTLFLRRDLNIKLRPKILDLVPGTRVVSNIFDMGDWKPDRTVKVEDENYYFKNHTVHFWVVPAKVSGKWKLPQGELILNQNFQLLTGTLGNGNVTTPIEGKMNGNEIRFTTDGRQYAGRIAGGNRMILEVNDGDKSQFQNAPVRPISALVGNFNPRNTPSIPAIEISDPP